MSQQLPVYSLSSYCAPKPTARTLISAVGSSEGGSAKAGEQKAFLCWQTVGRGRVLYVGTDTLWKWQTRAAPQEVPVVDPTPVSNPPLQMRTFGSLH